MNEGLSGSFERGKNADFAPSVVTAGSLSAFSSAHTHILQVNDDSGLDTAVTI